MPSCRLMLIAGVVTGVLASPCFAQRGDTTHVHDPVIAKDGDTYWVFSTGHGVPVRSSKNFVDWTYLGPALQGIPQWASRHVPNVEFPWAPDISFFNQRFHLYYSISTVGSRQSCIGLATNKTLDPTSPQYTWVDQGVVVFSTEKDNLNCIDPNVVMDEKGKPWLTLGSFWSGIYLMPLNPNTGKPAGGQPLNIASRNGGAIEAPFIIRHGGHYYLFVSFDECCKGRDSTYKVMVGRSRDIQGPYRDFTGERLLDGGGTLVLAGYGNVRGPGHNGFISLPEGDFMVHHFYDAKNDGKATMQIRPVFWTEDGWPVVGGPNATLEAGKGTGPVPHDVAGRWTHIVNDGDGDPLELKQDGRIGDGNASWNLKGNVLEMRWPRGDAPNGVWIDRCLVGPKADWYAGYNQQGMLIRGVR